MKLDFDRIVDHAMRSQELAGMRPVVEKEVLHYDILYALDRAGLLRDIVFQGGTALRLCHGASRYSEDLDFVGGRDFRKEQLMEMRTCILDHIAPRYGLEVKVKNPREMEKDPLYFGVKTERWQIAVSTTPGRPDLKSQKIKIEVANVPAYTSEPRSPLRNYDLIPHGYSDVLVPTETIDEIMADKVVSLTACENRIRYRDIWDLAWLSQRSAKLRPELLEAKIDDYRIDGFRQKLESRIEGLLEVIRRPKFHDEMSRFITAKAQETSIERDGFKVFLANTVGDILGKADTLLYKPREEFEFEM